jgi:hypothetical protein
VLPSRSLLEGWGRASSMPVSLRRRCPDGGSRRRLSVVGMPTSRWWACPNALTCYSTGMLQCRLTLTCYSTGMLQCRLTLTCASAGMLQPRSPGRAPCNMTPGARGGPQKNDGGPPKKYGAPAPRAPAYSMGLPLAAATRSPLTKFFRRESSKVAPSARSLGASFCFERPFYPASSHFLPGMCA